MGELRLYAVGIEEVRALFGADPEVAGRARAIAGAAFAPAEPDPTSRRLRRLGPLFKRVPGAVLTSPTQPEPHDLEVLLAGSYATRDRLGATWRLLEALIQGLAWGSTRLSLTPPELDRLDYTLSRAGAPSAVGLRHLVSSNPGLCLTPVPGLTVGYHPYAVALETREAYRAAAPGLSPEQHEFMAALTSWLGGYPSWAEAAVTVGRPRPDLIGCYAA